MAVKAKVTVAKKSTESGGALLSISSYQNRTTAQIKKANSVMKAGKGRWFTHQGPSQHSKGTIWFHDGLLGWHLRKADPKPVTDENWSIFSPDDMIAPPNKTYQEVDSPFKKPVKK